MPTFSSIGIHPELGKRLVTESRNSEEHQLVTTPQALLSRNPGQLRLLNEDGCTSRPLAVQQVLKLRYEVATALIAQTKTGARLQRIRPDQDEEDTEHPGTLHSPAKKQRLTIPGTVSVLELLRYDESSMNTPTSHGEMHMPVLRTGCRKLDEIVALPVQYCKVSTRMDILSSSPAATGIPFGYVTQFAGPPATGKTQLALQLAATATDLHQTWYICSSTPPVQRLWELCHHNYAIMQRTVFCHATDDYQVLKRLAELESHLLEHQQTNEDQYARWKPVLLVLDSCSGCLAAAGDNNDDSLLMTVAVTIRRLTRHYSLTTILINGTVSNRDATATQKRPIKAALGHRWNNTVADIALWFEATTAGNGTVRATLERHASKRCTKDDSATFGITALGMKDVP
jgi:hypothetical protein